MDQGFMKRVMMGFVRAHILYHAVHGRIYGLWIIHELQRHGYSLSPGTVYPILHEMEASGLLISTRVLVGGKRRRIYQSTEKGRRALEEIKGLLSELCQEVG